jgi:putative FmdB family regulatory protein
MPLFDYMCEACGRSAELLMTAADGEPECKFCGSRQMRKLLAAPSSLSGIPKAKTPGLGDTTCCGSPQSEVNCDGPGSCCGKSIS